MFDTTDFSPLCMGTYIAILVGFLVFAIGPVIEEKFLRRETEPRSRISWGLIALLVIPIVCVATSIVYDGLARLSLESRGCDRPPKDGFSQTGLIGTWGGTIETAWDSTIIIEANGQYKQTINNKRTGFNYESDWKSWRITYSSKGLPYVHLLGLRMCAYWNQMDCRTEEDHLTPVAVGDTKDPFTGEYYWYDFCQETWVNTTGEAVFMVFEGGTSSPRGIRLVPFTKSSDGTTGPDYRLREP